MTTAWKRAIALLAVACTAWMSPARAEVSELRVARQYGIGYLQLMVMEHESLIEKHARAAGLPDLKVSWNRFTDGTVMNDAILSGNLDFAGGGIGSFITLWDRTHTSLKVKAVAALNSMPAFLNSRVDRIRSVKDFTPQDRIALPGVKVSPQAVTLQLAAAQAFGDDAWNRLDSLTVNMAHPVGMQALLGGQDQIVAHFTSPPFQYMELANPGIHKVLSSFEIWGGPQTFITVWAISRFRDENPKTYGAFLAALEEATAFIKAQPKAAAEIYLEMTGDKRLKVDDLLGMLADPDIRYTLVPENMVKFAEFKKKTGTIKRTPDSWKDFFFPGIHHLAGS
ncbi:MAG: ABC transporter substrate-binding protein [Gemmatimonadales bacterium]|nr:ABC transporter substrate-binding protein [Gemmatimonadales bacterium]